MAAFSTPYLPNNTLKLKEGENYTFEVVFQNIGNVSTVMSLKILNGQEWTDPDNLSVSVPPMNYDTKSSFRISAPERIELHKDYNIEYSVSTGDKGGEGMVPVVSMVKKSFKIRVESEITPPPDSIAEEESNSYMPVIIASIFIFIALVLLSLILFMGVRKDA